MELLASIEAVKVTFEHAFAHGRGCTTLGTISCAQRGGTAWLAVMGVGHVSSNRANSSVGWSGRIVNHMLWSNLAVSLRAAVIRDDEPWWGLKERVFSRCQYCAPAEDRGLVQSGLVEPGVRPQQCWHGEHEPIPEVQRHLLPLSNQVSMRHEFLQREQRYPRKQDW